MAQWEGEIVYLFGEVGSEDPAHHVASEAGAGEGGAGDVDVGELLDILDEVDEILVGSSTPFSVDS